MLFTGTPSNIAPHHFGLYSQLFEPLHIPIGHQTKPSFSIGIFLTKNFHKIKKTEVERIGKSLLKLNVKFDNAELLQVAFIP